MAKTTTSKVLSISGLIESSIVHRAAIPKRMSAQSNCRFLSSRSRQL